MHEKEKKTVVIDEFFIDIDTDSDSKFDSIFTYQII